MSRGAWEATVNEGKELDTTEHTHNVSVKSPCLLLNIIFLDVIVSEIEFFVSFWDCLCCYIQI